MCVVSKPPPDEPTHVYFKYDSYLPSKGLSFGKTQGFKFHNCFSMFHNSQGSGLRRSMIRFRAVKKRLSSLSADQRAKCLRRELQLNADTVEIHDDAPSIVVCAPEFHASLRCVRGTG